jgi:hypothetical protein
MKKILVAATTALALATPALAFDIKWSGDFNHRFMHSTQADLATNRSPEGYLPTGNFVNELVPFADLLNTKQNSGDSDFFGALKYRLTMAATDDDKKVKGVLGFEIGDLKFGSAGQNGAPFAGDGKDTLELRWAYTEFEVPFDKASKLSLGLMPVGYNKFLWSDNAAGVKWVSKRGPLGYSLGWFRNGVTNNGLGGDVAPSNKLTNDDVYAFDVTYTVKDGPKLNAFALYYELGQEAVAGATSVMDQRIYLGAAAEGQVGALFYGFTGIYLGGELKAGDGTTFTNSGLVPEESSLDREAYLLNAELTYKLDKFRIKGGWLYSTGDDDTDDDTVDNFINIDAYMGGFGSVVVFDSIADDNTLIPTPYIRSKGLNMPYLSVDYDMTDKTSFGASYLYILAAEDITDVNGLNGEKDLGHEFSVRASHKITKNLTAAIQAGYLVGGDAWDNMATDALGNPTDADDVLRTEVGFRYMF